MQCTVGALIYYTIYGSLCNPGSAVDAGAFVNNAIGGQIVL